VVWCGVVGMIFYIVKISTIFLFFVSAAVVFVVVGVTTVVEVDFEVVEVLFEVLPLGILRKELTNRSRSISRSISRSRSLSRCCFPCLPSRMGPLRFRSR